MRRPAAIGALAAGILVLGLAGPPSAGAQPEPTEPEKAAPAPSAEATFAEGHGDPEIVKKLTTLILNAEPGSTIEATQYRLWDSPVVNALRYAAGRDVAVRIIVDHGTRNDSKDEHFKELESELEEDGDDDTWVKVCDDSEDEDEDRKGCNGDNAMHNKFFLFSKTGGDSNVVTTGSANLSEDSMGGTGGWNSLYTSYKNKPLYDRFGEYFDHLELEDGESDYYGENPPVTYGDTKAYFYPRAEGSGNDTYYNSLKEVDCEAEPTTIRVNMWSITRKGIAKKLHQLADEGCSVNIVATRIGSDACKLLTGAGGVSRYMSIRGFKDQEHGTHQKNMMIDGHYLKNDTAVVFTGSHNWNYYSWTRNDENVLRIMDNRKIHHDFTANFIKANNKTDTGVETRSQCGNMAPPKSADAEQEVA